MTSGGFLIRCVLEAPRADVEVWCKLSRWNKLLRIRRIEPCYNIVLAEDDMVDVARICHIQQAVEGVAQFNHSRDLP